MPLTLNIAQGIGYLPDIFYQGLFQHRLVPCFQQGIWLIVVSTVDQATYVTKT